MNWKKSLIFCISFIAIFFGEIAINIACGPEQDPYDYYVSFFHNNVQGESYAPFAFNGLLYLSSEDEVLNEQDVNSAEWAKYLVAKPKDVRLVMYELDSVSSALLSKNSFKWTSSLPDSLKNNSFLIRLSKNRSALNYYRAIKAVEPMISVDKYSWTQPARDTSFLIRSANSALSLIEKEKDEFLKIRYAYHAQRTFRYGDDIANSKLVYEKYIRQNPSLSAVKGWALAQYAGLVKDPNQGAYLFSKVFASNPEKRILSYRNYFLRETDINQVLKFAKNDSEKGNIYAIHGFKKADADIQQVKEVYECNPKSPLIGPLLIREVNKLEQNLLERSKIAYDYYSATTGGKYYRYNYGKNLDSLKKANLKHLATVRNFAVRVANEKRYSEPDFGNIIAAYLSWIENKDQLALQYLSKVNVGELSVRLKDQYRITELLIRTGEIKRGVNLQGKGLVSTLKWLDEKRFAENKKEPTIDDGYGYYRDEGESDRFTVTARNFYQQVLAPAYAKIGDTAKAALAMLKGDMIYKSPKINTFKRVMSYQTNIFWHQCLSEKSLQKIAEYKTAPTDESIINFITTSLNQLKSDDFYELQGTSYLRSHEYEKAITCFNKLSKSYQFFSPENWEWLDNGKHIVHKLYANTFIESITDYPKTYVAKPNGLNKKTFAQKMLRLETLAKSDVKNASLYYYQLANALYQTGEFGNSWFFISYDFKVFVNKERAKYDYNNDYKLALKAQEYFAKARALSKDENFKAKCSFMLARCEQKKILMNYNAIKWNDDQDYEKQQEEQNKLYKQLNANNPYFKELKNQYQGTSFYKVAVGDCSYLRDFLSPQTP